MKWTGGQQIVAPAGAPPFGQYRLMAPTPWLKNPSVIRIFCGFCDSGGISRPGYVDVDAANPAKVLGLSEAPLMELGLPGDFDDNGLCPTSIVELPDGRLWMYYFGFQLQSKVPFTMFAGIAESTDGGKIFRRLQRTPVLDRTAPEPLMRSGSFMMLEGGIYKAWYTCGVRWITIGDKQLHEYNLHYLESDNGIVWPASGRRAVSILAPDEYGLGRPYVIRHAQGYMLFYSIRSRSRGYRLGYAVSKDGKAWQRKDDMEILGEPAAWEKEMQCYCAVMKIRDRWHLFYNGNNLGATGFGYAVCDDLE